MSPDRPHPQEPLGGSAAGQSADLAVTGAVALGLRLFIALLARDHFPPADDGVLYDRLAHRLASGLGYTWGWPDGTVTAVAHYPVGYPALLALVHLLHGGIASALVLNAVIGAMGAVAVHFIASEGISRRAARWAGLCVAIHPALLAYTPAIMTEGVCGALLAFPFALALVARRRDRFASGGFALLAGVALGAATLVRPQSIVLLPAVIWLIAARHRAMLGILIVAGLFATLAPWLARNEHVFGRPVMVSANGGWNLLIGTDAEGHGGWRALDAPEECREVWDEAAKDVCFGIAARRRIVEHPLDWLTLAPAKLGCTFDLGGSGLSYLSRSRPDLIPRWAVLVEGGLETLLERIAVLMLLLDIGLAPGPFLRQRRAAAVIMSLFLLTRYAWPAYVALATGLAATLCEARARTPLRIATCSVLASTLVTHAVFFGAGRYALLTVPWLAAAAATTLAQRPKATAFS